VRLVDDTDRVTKAFRSGASLTVEIDFIAHQAVENAIFGVSAHTDADSLRCFDLSTEPDAYSIGELSGPGSISLHIDRLDLAAGRYRLDVGVYSSEWRPYDYHWQAIPFAVHGAIGGGPLGPPHRWHRS
jgi:lipopolysaccharide transport system ATP-binding protein